MTAPARKPVQPAKAEQRNFIAIQGDGVPPWMAERGLKKGDYLMLSKAQLRTQQRPDKSLKVQVWATGMLHSPGYKGEEATTMRNGKPVPLTPGDIATELFKIAQQHYTAAGIAATTEQLKALKETKETIRRALMELEDEGVAQRTDLTGTPLRLLKPAELKRLPSGKTRIFFWLVPRLPDPKSVTREWNHRQLPIPPPVEVDKNCLPTPPIWKILNVFQIEKPGKTLISDPLYHKKVEAAYGKARRIFVSEMDCKVDIECLPTEVAYSCLPEVVTTGGAFERKVESGTPGSSVLVDIHKTDKPAAASLSQVQQVARALRIDAAAARRLFEDTQKTEPKITGREIVELCQLKMAQVKNQKIGNMVGLLLRSVPGMASGATLEMARTQLKREDTERAEKIAAIVENWENWEEDDRAGWLKEFPEIARMITKGATA